MSLTRLIVGAIAERLRAAVEPLIHRLRNPSGPGLNRSQRQFLLGDFRTGLARQVEDAKARYISDQEARRLSLHRSLIRWLEQGEFPGPEAIPYLERLLSEIPRNPTGSELAEHEALVAAIHDLGGDAGTAAEIWQEPDPELTAGIGRNLSRLMDDAGLTVVELAQQSGLELDAVIAYVYGVEELRAEEILRLAAPLRVEPGSFFVGLESFGQVDRDARVEPIVDDDRGGDAR
ncbi:MAG TPA: helix-turn-helix transcriptional regulator [Solirubrobacterales bacterium]|jgi:hypothetical protein|nr:helix-turn-helix transcriptional regulator [Solirubrobacterales bacterium]